MKQRIRKISVAQGYLTNDIMNYVIDNVAFKDYKIAVIEKQKDLSHIIKIKNSDNELVVWKEFNHNVAVSVEYSLTYDKDMIV